MIPSYLTIIGCVVRKPKDYCCRTNTLLPISARPSAIVPHPTLPASSKNTYTKLLPLIACDNNKAKENEYLFFISGTFTAISYLSVPDRFFFICILLPFILFFIPLLPLLFCCIFILLFVLIRLFSLLIFSIISFSYLYYTMRLIVFSCFFISIRPSKPLPI